MGELVLGKRPSPPSIRAFPGIARPVASPLDDFRRLTVAQFEGSLNRVAKAFLDVLAREGLQCEDVGPVNAQGLAFRILMVPAPTSSPSASAGPRAATPRTWPSRAWAGNPPRSPGSSSGRSGSSWGLGVKDRGGGGRGNRITPPELEDFRGNSRISHGTAA